jgi:hypothetical protein
MFRTGLVALVVLSAGLHAQDLPKAEAVLDRYVEATGGKAAYDKVKSMSMTGTFEVPAQGIKGKMQRFSAGNDLYVGIDIPGAGKIETGVSNGVAWETNPFTGPRIKEGEEAEDAIREAMLDSAVQWRKLYPKVENAGIEKVNGEDAYKIVATPDKGKPETTYYSKATGLALKTKKVATTQMGDIEVESSVSDYKEFGGIKVPTKVQQSAAGQEFTVTIEDVAVNPEIPASRFALPADIKALRSKAQQKKQ